jgi:NADH-quinone oxidoreductase subunit G
MEGRLQQSAKVVEPPGEAKELWKVLRVFASYLGLKKLEFDSLSELRSTLVPELTKEKVLQLQELKFNDGEVESEEEMESGKASELEAFHYVPIYSSDPVVRRASSLQKTPLANGPSVLFNPKDILARGIENGKTITLDIENSVGRRKYSLVASTDKNVAPGVVAILGGKLGYDSISGSIMGLES